MISPMSSTGAALIMSTLADKMQRGVRLTDTDQNIIMTTSAQIYASSFGPMPADMRLPPAQLPEHVKGILTNFAL